MILSKPVFPVAVSAGYSLVELLIALSLAMVAIMGATTLNTRLQQQKLALAQHEQALRLAEQQLALLQTTEFTMLASSSVPIEQTVALLGGYSQTYAVSWAISYQDSVRKDVKLKVAWAAQRLELETSIAEIQLPQN